MTSRDPAAPIVIVQVIDVQYGKATRGGAGARRRASLPSTLPVPEVHADTLHLVTFNERRDFRPDQRTDALPLPSVAPQIVNRLRVTRSADELVVHDGSDQTRALVVSTGWGQLRCNQLEPSWSESWYRDLIINVALALPPATGNVFAGAPSVQRDLRRPIERRRQARVRR